ncbi:MAG: hypothetical protein LBR40_00485 [Bacilli bacterium]|jgi:hypothetical protein|nr:hypothetical protein [Bacilli bacterium]
MKKYLLFSLLSLSLLVGCTQKCDDCLSYDAYLTKYNELQRKINSITATLATNYTTYSSEIDKIQDYVQDMINLKGPLNLADKEKELDTYLLKYKNSFDQLDLYYKTYDSGDIAKAKTIYENYIKEFDEFNAKIEEIYASYK